MASYTSTANVVLSVNGKQAQKMLAALERDAKRLERQISAAASAGDKASMKKLQRELNQTNRLMDQLKGSAASTERVLTRLDKATPKELNKVLRQLKNELNGIERGTAAWDAHVAKIKAVRSELDKVNSAMRDQESLSDRVANWLNKWQMALVAVGAAVTGLVMAGRKAVQAYADMEQEMANVRKFTGMTAEEVGALNVEFRKIDTRSPREELNKLAQEAGRLGKSSQEDVLSFVRAADKINVALDDLGSGATLTLSKLTGIFGDEKRLGTEKALLSVGSVINELSQNCSASAPYIAEFASRMGGVGAQAGLTVQQIMAFAAVLDTKKQKLEAASTALSQVIVRIYQDPAKYAKVAGMDVTKFSKLVRTDMNAALIEFLSTLKQAGKMDVLSPMFKDMGENGSRAISALSTLANHIDQVKAQQIVANDAFREATSIDREFEVQNNTVQAGLDKAKNRVHELAVELGEKLQPVMRLVISSSTVALKALSVMVDFVAKYRSEIIIATFTLTAYLVIVRLYNTHTMLAAQWTKIWNAALALGNRAMPIMRLALAALTNAVQYFTNGLKVNYAMQQRWRASMEAMKFSTWAGLILAVVGAIALYVKRSFDAIKNNIRLREETRKLADVSQRAAEIASKEVSVLRQLYNAATNEALSKDKRTAAAKRLLSLYPTQFKNMTSEQIMLGQAKNAYDALTQAIINNAKAKAAAEKIQENEKKILDLELQLDEDRREFLDASSARDAIRNRNRQQSDRLNRQTSSLFGSIAAAGGGLDEAYRPESTAEVDRRVVNAATGMREKKSEIAKLRNANTSLTNRYGNNKVFQQELNVNVNVAGAAGGGAVSVDSSIGDADLSGVSGGDSLETDQSDDSTPSKPYRSQKEAEKEAKKAEQERKKKAREAESAKKRAERLKKQAETKRRQEFKDELGDAQGERDREEAENITARSQGLISYKEYLDERQRILEDYYDRCEQVYRKYGLAEEGLEDEDLLRLRKKREEQFSKYLEENAQMSRQQYEFEKGIQETQLQVEFYNPKSKIYQNEEAQQQGMFAIRYKALRKTRDLYVETSKEYADVEAQMQELEENEKLRRQKRYAEMFQQWKSKYNFKEERERYYLEYAMLVSAYKHGLVTVEEYYEAIKQLKKKYVTDTLPDSAKPVEKSPEVRQKEEDLKKIKAMYEQGLLSEKEYQEARKRIEKSYRKSDSGSSAAQSNMVVDIYTAWREFFDSSQEDGRNWATNLANLAQSVFAVMSAGMQAYTEYANACADLEIAKAEKKYDRLIELAEGNSYKTKKAEREKEEAIAKIKSQVARRQYAMQIAQAIANTAVNALMAYGSAQNLPYPASQIVGALAAAMAVAQGMAQIAIMRKQQQVSEAQGYQSGGFTPQGKPDEVAGIVHKGEWVASQRLVNNPRTRPLLEALDYAQRTNTIGSLTAADVSRTITAPAVIAAQPQAPSMVNNTFSSASTPPDDRIVSVLDRLDSRLNEPFVTVNTVSGDHGIQRAQEEYDRLMKNKSPKSRK